MNRLLSSAMVGAWLSLGVASASAAAAAAEVKCARASTPTERAICDSAALQQLDAQMTAYYEMLQEAPPVESGMAYREFRDTLRNGQRAWLKSRRDACGAQPACIEDAYDERVTALRGLARAHLGLTMRGTQGTRPVEGRIDYLNAGYRIGDDILKLVDGKRSAPAVPGAPPMRVTTVVGQPVSGQIEAKPALAVVVADQPGGSGTFYHAALVFDNGEPAATAPIGDRIEPLSIAFEGDTLTVKYLDRRPDEPMVAKPSIAKTLRLRLDTKHDKLIKAASLN